MVLPFNIAMESPISDRAAISFSAAFYDSIGAEKDVGFSLRQDVHQLRLASSSTPVEGGPTGRAGGADLRGKLICPSEAAVIAASIFSWREIVNEVRRCVGVGAR